MAESFLPQNLHGFSVAGLTLDAAYDKIDSEILRWEDHVRNLKALRNSIAPVSCLPDELISIVLNLSQRLSKDPPLARLYLSWVCSRWRDVALGDRKFWRTIKNYPSFTCPQYIQECFARSKPLTLEMDLRFPSGALIGLCISRIHRISSLTYTPAQETSCNPPKFLDQPAPQLSSLSLAKTVLVKKPFNGVYILKHLKLVGCRFDWGFPLSISALTTLHIATPTNSIPVDAFTAKLVGMSSLVNLYLRDCLVDATTPITTQYNLPSLRNLYVEDNQASVFGLLRAIDTPVICSLRASIRTKSFGEEELLDALDVFKRLHPSLWSDIRHLILRPLSIEVEGFSSASRDIIVFHPLRLSGTILSACNQLSVHRLEVLSIDRHFKNLTKIAGILRSLRNVWHLRLGSAEQKVANALLASCIQEEDGTIEISLPSIMELHCNAPSDALFHALEQRQEILKSRLPKLTFRKCAPPDIKRYSKVADFVDYDGIVSVEELKADNESGW
ncbi:hypothetical protein BDN72DRAFT_850250 [Pluteus cervinus]|uniref:Uncharacterized protein n=1 Tax=Pluteus cervinus TaxID=181527 RepID=A0ACD3A512_9AGAR|nr:hypothetical protein BDN72DRAFT_850250 [Pluteus cervinus]